MEDIVRWSLNVFIEAEEYGVNSSNVDSMQKQQEPSYSKNSRR